MPTDQAIHVFSIDPGLDEVAIAHWTVPARHGLPAQDLVRDHLSAMSMVKTKPTDRTSTRLRQIGEFVTGWVGGRLQSVGEGPRQVYAVVELPARGGMYHAKAKDDVPLEAVMRRMQVSQAASGVVSHALACLDIEVWYWTATGDKARRQEVAHLALRGAKANSWAGRTYPPDLLDAIAQGLQVLPMFVDLRHGRPLPGVGSILGRAGKAVPGYGGPPPRKRTTTRA